jgi:hypothetical protein
MLNQLHPTEADRHRLICVHDCNIKASRSLQSSRAAGSQRQEFNLNRRVRLSPRWHFGFASAPAVKWFGLGIGRKMVLNMTVVSFNRFCSVCQRLNGVRPVSLTEVCE